MSSEHPIVVIGGGITGLAAALRLQSHAPDRRLMLVEAETRLGGKILTVRERGFVIEGGPDSFLSSKPRGIGLCRDLGIDGNLEGTRAGAGGAFVLRDGALHRMPEGFSGLVPSRLRPLFDSDLLSSAGKIRAALEPYSPVGEGESDESLGSFMTRRFGREAYERLIEPLMAGIYAGEGDRLSLLATFPQLRAQEREHGSLLKAIGSARRPAGPRRSPFLTPIDGMGAMVDALAQRLDRVEIRTGSRVERISLGPGDDYRVALDQGDPIMASALILALPAFAAASALESLDSALAADLATIDYVSSATISLAYPRERVPHPLDGTGYVVPRVEGSPILACSWSSVKFEHRAPESHALLRIFMGRSGRADILRQPDEVLVAMARAELRERLGVTAGPEFYRLFRWQRAMPQYAVGHLERLDVIEERVRTHPGLTLAGAAYRGVGIPDCIESGEAAADAVLAAQRKSPAR